MSQGGAGVRRAREAAQQKLAALEREGKLPPFSELVQITQPSPCSPNGHGPFFEVKKRGWYGKLIQLHCRRCGQPVER